MWCTWLKTRKCDCSSHSKMGINLQLYSFHCSDFRPIMFWTWLQEVAPICTQQHYYPVVMLGDKVSSSVFPSRSSTPHWENYFFMELWKHTDEDGGVQIVLVILYINGYKGLCRLLMRKCEQVQTILEDFKIVENVCWWYNHSLSNCEDFKHHIVFISRSSFHLQFSKLKGMVNVKMSISSWVLLSLVNNLISP